MSLHGYVYSGPNFPSNSIFSVTKSVDFEQEVLFKLALKKNTRKSSVKILGSSPNLLEAISVIKTKYFRYQRQDKNCKIVSP